MDGKGEGSEETGTLAGDYERLFRRDLTAHLEAARDEWIEGMRETPMAWSVENAEVDFTIRKLHLAAHGQVRLAEVKPLQRRQKRQNRPGPRELVLQALAETDHLLDVGSLLEILTTRGAEATPGSIATMLSRLRRQGVVDRPIRGRYRLAESERRRRT